jgi:restriction system protein
MAGSWYSYQEDAADFFRSIGLSANTNVELKGVRTNHAVDVVVKSHHAGFSVTWIVECKLWKKRVSKLHVLALREIVAEVGADRGVLLSENGFQKGANEAACLTNIDLTSLARLKCQASEEISKMRLIDLSERIDRCKEIYWSIPKRIRIEHGLRPDIINSGYSAISIIDYSDSIIFKALKSSYPIRVDDLVLGLHEIDVPKFIRSTLELVNHLTPLIDALENKIKTCVDQISER